MKVKTEIKAGKNSRCWEVKNCGGCKKCVKNANKDFGTHHNPKEFCAANGIC